MTTWQASLQHGLQYTAKTLSERLAPGTEEFWMLLSPVIAYWLAAGFYELLDMCPHPAIARYRVTRKQPGRGNAVTRQAVFVRVLLQQLLQTLVGCVVVLADPEQCTTNPPKGPLHSAAQFILAMFVMDTWQYWIHRWMHVNTFLYKHIHSTHHRLYMPYAMGALYNHPVEALLLDSVGAAVCMLTVGLSCQLSTHFFVFSTIKTVCDHSNYRWPLNPLHDIFPNCAAYHDVHHDLRYIKSNFSQPYFTHWDVLLNTYMEPKDVHCSQQEIDANLGLAEPTNKKPATQSANSNQQVKKQDSVNSEQGSESGQASRNNSQASVVDVTEDKQATKAQNEVVMQPLPTTPNVTTRSRSKHQVQH